MNNSKSIQSQILDAEKELGRPVKNVQIKIGGVPLTVSADWLINFEKEYQELFKNKTNGPL